MYLLPVAFPSWGEKKPDSPFPFRAAQLVFRSREAYEAHRAFSNIVETGRAGPSRCETSSTYDFSQWKDMVDLEGVELTGHSFGGATAVRGPSGGLLLLAHLP